MPKIRILPLRSVVLDDLTATEGAEVNVDVDTAKTLVSEGFAELTVVTPEPASNGA